MTSAELLTDAFGRIREAVHEAVAGLTPGQLSFQPSPETNSIAWLVWHLTRIQDDHVAGVAQAEQVWTSGGWAQRFALPFPERDTGYGHRPADVAAVRVASADLLTGYHDAVHEQTIRFTGGLTDGDLPRIVDKRWDPPVTLAVRLVSVISDDLQHAGQAAFLRGMIEHGGAPGS
jgi:uncharacterized damage-inducible protein DinB